MFGESCSRKTAPHARIHLEVKELLEPCSTYAVLTPVIDEDLLLAARKVALDRGTSVNQLVRDYLAALVEEPRRKRNWKRDDLYDR